MKKIIIVVLFLFSFKSISLGSSILDLVDKNSTVIINNPDGKSLISINANKDLVPASTLKILTALVAIKTLGSDYRFKTEFYINKSNDLIIKGYGDPLLISEIIDSVSRELSGKLKKTKIQNVFLDGSYFKKNIVIPGVTNNSSQPYDAPNGAICSNFNTVFFKKKRNGIYISAESQTPLLNFVRDRIRRSGLLNGRIKLNSRESSLYTGYLFKHFLKKNGVSFSGTIKNISLKNELGLKLIHTYRSVYSLEKIIKKLMLFSNNFIANQIFLTLGAEKEGVPGDLQKGSLVVKRFINKNKKIKLRFIEGSGISRQNKISGNNLMLILSDFQKYYKLLKKEGNDFFKTGTMKDVSSRAGFIKKNKKLYSYVIIVNGKKAYQRLTRIYKYSIKFIK